MKRFPYTPPDPSPEDQTAELHQLVQPCPECADQRSFIEQAMRALDGLTIRATVAYRDDGIVRYQTGNLTGALEFECHACEGRGKLLTKKGQRFLVHLVHSCGDVAAALKTAEDVARKGAP